MWLPRGRRGSGVDWELGVNRYKLLPLEWISNEILLCSTENYVSSLNTEHDNGIFEKEYIHVCVIGSPCYILEKKLYWGNNNLKKLNKKIKQKFLL